MEITVEQQGNQDPRARVTWRLSEEDSRYLERSGAENPYVLIITWNEGNKKEERWLAPLARGEQFVQFHGAGRNKVFVGIVWGKRFRQEEDLWKKFLAREKVGVYQHTCVSPLGIGLAMGHVCADMEVQVDARLFAKKPPKWVDGWVNGLWDSQPRDRCHFGKRAAFAFTLQPVLVVVVSALVVVFGGVFFISKVFVSICTALVVLGAGYRGIDWEPVYKPWHDLSDLTDDLKPTALIKRGLWYITPTAFLCYWVLTLLVRWLMHFAHWDLPLLAGIGFFLVICFVFDRLPEVSNQPSKKPSRPRKPLVPVALLTDGSTTAVLHHSFRDAVMLTYQGTKAKLCRPWPW